MAHYLLGFIPVNACTKLGMPESEYNVADMTFMGVIPISVQQVVAKYTRTLHRNTDQEPQKGFLQAWTIVKTSLIMKNVVMSMTIESQVTL